MVRGNARFEVEQVEQLALLDGLPTHHSPPPSPRTSSRRNHDSPMITSDFFNSIGQEQKCSAPADVVRFTRGSGRSSGHSLMSASRHQRTYSESVHTPGSLG